MRCMALAQGWQDRGGTVHFLCANLPGSLEEALLAQKFQVTHMSVAPGSADDVNACAQHATDYGWTVVDGDLFSSEFLGALKVSLARVLLIDDYGARHNLAADVVLNQNLNANPRLYESSPSATRLLLGTSYLLLRREFRRLTRRVRVAASARQILVTLGGSDPDNLSLRVANACAMLEPGNFLVTLATTSANPHLPQLLERFDAKSASVALLVDALNIAEVMANSDLAVIASGGTLWELLYLGCPVLSYSRNQAQARLISETACLGAARDMGPASAFDGTALRSEIEELASSSRQRQAMSDAGARIADGRGVDRVIEHLLQD